MTEGARSFLHIFSSLPLPLPLPLPRFLSLPPTPTLRVPFPFPQSKTIYGTELVLSVYLPILSGPVVYKSLLTVWFFFSFFLRSPFFAAQLNGEAFVFFAFLLLSRDSKGISVVGGGRRKKTKKKSIWLGRRPKG